MIRYELKQSSANHGSGGDELAESKDGNFVGYEQAILFARHAFISGMLSGHHRTVEGTMPSDHVEYMECCDDFMDELLNTQNEGIFLMPHPNGDPTEEEKESFYSGFEWKPPKRPTGQMTTDGLRYMALTYLHLLEQDSGDDDDIRVMYAISMHPKIQALLSRSDEIMEAGK